MKIKTFNNREKIYINIVISILFIGIILILSYILPNSLLASDVSKKNLLPSFYNLFGTDWLGRDMFTRTVKGIRLSIYIGFITSFISIIIALLLAGLSAMGGKFLDNLISWLIEIFIGMPHLVFMILLAFIVGGGKKGIIIGVGLTHWPSLARVLRAEILKIKTENYIEISRQFGKSEFFIFKEHILRHILTQMIVGFILLFPHVILHESALTFLGFGLSPQTPALGIILSEGVSNISRGYWWLILFPAIFLILLVKSFDSIGDKVKILLNPVRFHE